MGRHPNDGLGHFGGRRAGSKNKPKTWRSLAERMLDDDRKQQQPLGNHVTILAALVVADALNRLIELIERSKALEKEGAL